MSTSGKTIVGAAEPQIVVAQFPATPNQRKYWREAFYPRGGAALNASFRQRLDGRISDAAITSALQALVDRHEILRTRLREVEGGQLIQEVLEKIQFKPDLVDIRHMPEEAREAELVRLGAAEARRPFDFTETSSPAPLFHVLLVRLAPEQAVIHFTFHHLVMDGWSVDNVVREFGELAAGFDAGSPPALPPVEMHFGDYALWQTDILSSGALDGEREYWRGKLAGMPRFEVEPDRPRVEADNEGEIRSIELPRELTDSFEALARANGHTLTTLATAAAAAALHLVTGEPEIVLGTQMAGREDPDAERIVGPLLNTVVLRVPASSEASFLAFAGDVRTVVQEAMLHQILPFEEVAAIAGDPGTPERTPLYSVNLVVQRAYISSASVKDSSYGNFQLVSLPSHSAGALWDLSFFMVGREAGWRLSCEGASALYDAATVDALLAVWRKVMEGAVRNPGAALKDLGVLEAHERRPAKAKHSPAAAPATAPIAAPAAAPPVAAVVVPASPARRNPRLEALRQRILALQPKGDKVPIIALNNSSVLYPVARAIGNEHPFFDIQFCPSPERIPLPERHFADHARDAVELIRLAQPTGPYVLFGLCICGAIAVEAARILQSEGEDVPLVILNDTYRPGYRERMSFLDRQQRAWQVRWQTFHRLRKRVQSGELTMAQWIDNYRLFRWLRITKILSSLGLLGGEAPRDPMQDNNRWFVEEVLLPSQGRFDLEPYSGRIVMFRSEEIPESRLFPRDLGWGGYAVGQFEVVTCPGTHDTMFRQAGAEVIGAKVRHILDEMPG